MTAALPVRPLSIERRRMAPILALPTSSDDVGLPTPRGGRVCRSGSDTSLLDAGADVTMRRMTQQDAERGADTCRLVCTFGSREDENTQNPPPRSPSPGWGIPPTSPGRDTTADAPNATAVLGGRYRLDHLLARGGMGAVWAGHDTLLDRPVAVKMLRNDVGSDGPAGSQRLLAEARAAAGLAHPNIVAAFDAGYDGGSFVLVMERLPGRSLADRLKEGLLTAGEARTLLSHVLAGLDAVHRAGLVHRDVKPANVLQATDGRWKVVDFGIAQRAFDDDDPTLAGTTIGTPAYLAPEQFIGDRATPRSDLWAVGVMLYEALVGLPPFSGDTPSAISHAVRTVVPPPLSALRPDIDLVLTSTVERALIKSPDQRFDSASAMAASLVALAPPTDGQTTRRRSEPLAPYPQRPPAGPSPPPGRRVAQL